MRAIAIESFGGAETLDLVDLEAPQPGPGEVLIRVVAAGVNPLDWQIREGTLSEVLPHRFPLVPGWDVAGVVEGFGPGAAKFRRGDRVWACARKPTVQWGCYAEYVVVPEPAVARMPAKLLFEEAAAVPVSALTAHQALFDGEGIGEKTNVLIHAASGGVGHFAVQMARNAGARVIGTAGTRNLGFVLGLGASGVIDYTQEDFRLAARKRWPDGLDFVLDTVGGETLDRSIDITKPGGTVVSVVDLPDEDKAAAHGVNVRSVFVKPDGERLGEMAEAVDRQMLKPHVQRIYGLSEAREAQQASEDRHVQGKLVLNL